MCETPAGSVRGGETQRVTESHSGTGVIVEQSVRGSGAGPH